MSKPDKRDSLHLDHETQRVIGWDGRKANIECLTCGNYQGVTCEDEGDAEIEQCWCQCSPECQSRVCDSCPTCARCGLNIDPDHLVKADGKKLCPECAELAELRRKPEAAA